MAQIKGGLMTRGNKIVTVLTEVRKRLQSLGFTSEFLHKSLLNNLRFQLTKVSDKTPSVLCEPEELREFLVAQLREFYQKEEEQMQGVALDDLARDVCERLKEQDFFQAPVEEVVVLSADETPLERDFVPEGTPLASPVDEPYRAGYWARAREVGGNVFVSRGGNQANSIVAVLFIFTVLVAMGFVGYWLLGKLRQPESATVITATNHTHPEYAEQTASAQATANQARIAAAANAERIAEVSKNQAEVRALQGQVSALQKQVQSLSSQRSTAARATSTRSTTPASRVRPRAPAMTGPATCPRGEILFLDFTINKRRCVSPTV